ncbi:MAG TPA: hypothetical protein VK338_06495 [Candidatus Nitrosocosmicus sp.]|nr:hypothetical protein [Candidatus Nitrosocosmicus sp.]
MPSIDLYLEKEDLPILTDLLNSDEEIAFLVSNGSKRWKAVKTLEKPFPGKYLLWHTSAKLSFVRKDLSYGYIENPWQSWTVERADAADPTMPFLGSNPETIEVDIVVDENRGVIPLSHIGWIGNRYKSIGQGATKETERWWKKLIREIKTIGHPVSRFDELDYLKAYAFPAALKAINQGKKRSGNPDE